MIFFFWLYLSYYYNPLSSEILPCVSTAQEDFITWKLLWFCGQLVMQDNTNWFNWFKSFGMKIWKMKISLSILLLSSEQWSGLLWSSVPGCWPTAGTLQTGLHPPEGSLGAAGQDATQQQRLRGGGLWYCNRWEFVYASLPFPLLQTLL